MNTTESLPILLVGGGLAGGLLAVMLAKRGFRVEVFERRPDMRVAQVGGGRSINLALSLRGIYALEQTGIADEVLRDALPMPGRLIHAVTGEVFYQPYGTQPHHYINSVSRSGLNIALLNEAAKYPNIRFHFEHRCTGFDLETGAAHFIDEKTGEALTVFGQTVIGTDGAGSAIRHSFDSLANFVCSEEDLGYGYKELTIPADENGSFRMNPDGLHIWPRGAFMLIALPNPDGTFTCTLFLPHSGETGFDRLQTPDDVRAFFQTHFPDALALIPNLTTDFFQNPTGRLATVRCYPWSYEGKAVILGDAAHAVVPFYGQGMNCSFEDCVVFDECLAEVVDMSAPPLSGGETVVAPPRPPLARGGDGTQGAYTHVSPPDKGGPGGDGTQAELRSEGAKNSPPDKGGPGGDLWARIFAEFESRRKPNADSIATLALENFVEMRDHTANPVFQMKRKVEALLESAYEGRYQSKYSRVTFSREPYAEAYRIGNLQDDFLMRVCADVKSPDDLDLETLLADLEAATATTGEL